jgi:hypothetical protein
MVMAKEIIAGFVINADATPVLRPGKNNSLL